MKISIVVSIYNGEKYLKELMDSLLKQSRKPDEVLFFDDKSSDNSVELVREFVANHNLNKWHLTINEDNKGWKRNFMEGMWSASGDLIFPCDQDDIWEKTKLEDMERIMLQHPEINLLTSNYTAFYESGKMVNGPTSENGKLIKQKLVKNFFKTKYPGCTYCARRNIIEKSKHYWQCDFPHDALLWRLAMFTDSLFSYNKSLIKWRKHEDSTYAIESLKVKSFIKKRQWFDYAIRVIDSLREYITKEEVGDKIKKEKILKKSCHWIKLRVKLYEKPRFTYWLQLIPYLKYYDYFRHFVADFYFAFLKNRGDFDEN